MRLGVFGGSFDPVHYGHLLLAECCREGCGLDQVWFIPAAAAPHKRDRQHAPDKHRVEMLQLALAGSETMRASTLEIDRGGVSYTVDTLGEIRDRQGDAELFFLMGGDSLADLPNWRKPAEICRLSTPVIAARPDAPPPDFDVLVPLVGAERAFEIARHRVEMPQIELSSTDIRRRVAEGRSIRYRTPRAVEKYIETAGLYRPE